MTQRKVLQTRHVLAVNDLSVEAAYYIDKLGFERDFIVPGWEFLSFGEFKVMLGECKDAMPAEDTGDHSYYVHVMVENVDEVFAEFAERGAQLTSHPGDEPWGLREFTLRTPEGHRMTFGQPIEP